MDPNNIIPLIAIGVIVIWLGALTYFVFSIRGHYNKLTDKTDRKTLTHALEVLLDNQDKSKEQIANLHSRLKNQEHNSSFFVQKVGLVRFNPFADTGGEQSFIISLLDSHNSGIVFTSLQGRSGTRWYAKQVKDGKGVQHELSKEEEESVKKAKALS